MAKYIEVQATVDRIPDCIADHLITTKTELLEYIESKTKSLLESLASSNRHTARYYSVMEELINSFQKKIRKTILPERLEDWWLYSFEISYRGAHLCLEHMGSAWINEEGTDSDSQTIDQIFPLVYIPARMLSVDEYAKLYEVEQEKQMEKMADIRGEVKDIAWGSQIRSYVFMPYTLVKDHRTGYETGNINAVMDGDLDGFINAYLKAGSLDAITEDVD